MTVLESLNNIKLDLTQLVLIVSGGSSNMGSDFDISPKDFLRYAKEDLNLGGERGIINSVSSAKRAIDYQVDEILSGFGVDYNKLPKSIEGFINCFDFNDDIPYKLKIIQSLNLAPGFIISKYRNLRNKLEHFYQLPTVDEAKEAIDIAELFIRSIDGYYRGLIDDFYITDKKNHIGEFEFRNGYEFFHNSEEKMIYLIEKIDGVRKNEIEINVKNPEFFGFIRLMNSINDEFELTESFRIIAKLIGHPMPKKHIKVYQK